MTQKEIAAAIRKELKTLGYTNKRVAVRGQRGGLSACVRVILKDDDVDLEKVKAVALPYKYYDRDEAGDILGGGNTFIFIEKEREFGTTIIA